MKSPKEVCLKAAELIRTKGHCKGELQNDAGSFCLLGALSEAATGDVYASPCDEEYETFRECRSALRLVTGKVMIAIWNDAPERTAEEVIGALEKAAEVLA